MTTNSLAIRDLSPMAYAMTRIAARFTGGTIFSPGTPVAPVTTEQTPRQFQYPVAVNLSQQPRRDYPSLTPFETLRYLAKKHPLASLCIRVRCEQVAMLPGGVVAKRAKEQASVQRDCDALDLWFQQPDRSTSRVAWLQQFVRDLLEIDAPTLYRRPARDGSLYGLEVIDGSTIKPLLDIHGRTVAYQQVIYGLALSQYTGRRAGPDDHEVIGEYAPGELWYQPYSPQVNSPYGRAPMEDLLEQAQIYLQKQGYDLGHFTDGNIPGALGVFDASGGGTALNIEQVAEFERNFNAVLQGDVSRGVKLKFVPFPMKIERLQELSTGGQYESAWEERMVKLVCAFYGVTPSEVGFTADVNRATSEGQENITYRRGIGPMAQWLKLNIFDPVIHTDFRRPDLEWRWQYGESEDKAMAAEAHASDIAAGVITAQESRTMRYPDLSGRAPGPPAAAGAAPKAEPAAAPGLAAVAKIAKADTGPDDAAERDAAEQAALVLLGGMFASQLARLRAAARQAESGATPARLEAFWLAEQSTITRALLPLWDETLGAAAGAGAGQLAIGVDWGLVNQSVLRLARAEAERLAGQLNATSKAQAAQIIEDWIATGGTMDELSERLAIIYGEQRAKMVAATEVTRLYAAGNRAAWAASGVVSGYRWQTARDERVCPICGPLHGEEYDQEDTEHLPPAHPNCRCWIVPVVMTAEELERRGG